jgi:hypothetical protein
MGCYVLSIDQLQDRGLFGVHTCMPSWVGRTRLISCHVKQLCNLEALGVSTAITRFLSVLTMRTTDESGEVQVATIAASEPTSGPAVT